MSKDTPPPIRAMTTDLESEVARLSAELKQKNAELQVSLKEKELLNLYLGSILENLQVGVLVLDARQKIRVANPKAMEMLGKRVTQATIQSLLNVLTEKKQGELAELTLRDPSKEERAISLSHSPLRDTVGAPVGTIIALYDLTDHKNLQEQLARRERLASMGEMVTQIAHEIRNPLAGIELFASLLLRDLADQSARDLVTRISGGVKSLNAIVNTYLDFARGTPISKAPGRISEVLEAVFSLAEPYVRASAVVVDLSVQDDDIICFDRDALCRAALNVVVNACQAMPSGGTLTVVAGIDRAKSQLVLSFHDTGCGMDQATHRKAGNAFFSTKADGTGLGLSISTEIVKAHGGTVAISSKLNKGTIVVFTLPTL